MKTLLSFAVALSLTLAALAAPAAKPNILLIVADDLGWGELGCQGNPEIPFVRSMKPRGGIAELTEKLRCAHITVREAHAVLRDRVDVRRGDRIAVRRVRD